MDKKTAAALASRAEGVRAGVDIGFADAAFSQALRQARAGVWMTVEDGAAARDAAAETSLFCDVAGLTSLHCTSTFWISSKAFSNLATFFSINASNLSVASK